MGRHGLCWDSRGFARTGRGNRMKVPPQHAQGKPGCVDCRSTPLQVSRLWRSGDLHPVSGVSAASRLGRFGGSQPPAAKPHVADSCNCSGRNNQVVNGVPCSGDQPRVCGHHPARRHRLPDGPVEIGDIELAETVVFDDAGQRRAVAVHVEGVRCALARAAPGGPVACSPSGSRPSERSSRWDLPVRRSFGRTWISLCRAGR